MRSWLFIRCILIYFIFFLFKIVTCLKLPLLEYNNSTRIFVLSSHSSCLLNSPVVIAVFKSLSHVQILANPWSTAHQVSLSFTLSLRFPKLMYIEPVMPSNHLILCLPSPLALHLSQRRSFQWVGSLHQVAKGLELQLQYQSFQWIFGVDFLEEWLVWSVQGILKSLLQRHSLKASFLQDSAFFMAQLSHSIHDYWKNHSFD